MTWNKKLKEWLKKEEDIQTADGKNIEVFSFNYNSDDNKTMSVWAKHFRNHYCSDEIIDVDTVKSIFAKSSGVLYLQNIDGVVLFTLSSVHCAESITATTSSNGVSKSKLHVASGLSSFNIFTNFLGSNLVFINFYPFLQVINYTVSPF